MGQGLMVKRQQQVLHDKKWIKFLKRTWLFRHLPFMDFALAAGSLATGEVSLNSDFDVIIGARYGRIFTARFFAAAAFGLFGWRRKKAHSYENTKTYESAKDKICLSHFVTEKSYRLAPPHNAYWENLYRNLVPVYGWPEKINEFFIINADWIGDQRNFIDDLRLKYRKSAWQKRFLEKLLNGKIGDKLEAFLREIQIKRIESGLRAESGYKPRIIYSNEELEFHPDTTRIEQMIKKEKINQTNYF